MCIGNVGTHLPKCKAHVLEDRKFYLQRCDTLVCVCHISISSLRSFNQRSGSKYQPRRRKKKEEEKTRTGHLDIRVVFTALYIPILFFILTLVPCIFHYFLQWTNKCTIITFMWPCIVTDFFVIKRTRCTNLTNLFCHETRHVSDSSSVHHHEFIHCTLSNGICHTYL